MFKALRIFVLLLILASVAQTAWLARSRATSWENTLHVAIYPIAADASVQTHQFLEGLKPDAFAPVEAFFEQEAKRHGLQLWHPLSIAVAPPVAAQPPEPPRNANALQAVFWSLQMRWWASRHDRIAGMKPAVRLFVRFHDPQTNPRPAHSVGVARGMLGVINAFASPSMAGSNNVIITHELMHTLGATDKYDPATNLPNFPDGYAEPERAPRHPQDFAEIMGGRIPRSATEAEIPGSLAVTRVGAATAREIGWLKP